MHTHTHMCKTALSPGCSYWSIWHTLAV